MFLYQDSSLSFVLAILPEPQPYLQEKAKRLCQYVPQLPIITDDKTIGECMIQRCGNRAITATNNRSDAAACQQDRTPSSIDNARADVSARGLIT